VAYSVLTHCEFVLVRMIPMPVHLAMDAASGALLAESPRLFGFAGRGQRYRLLHAFVGASKVLAAPTSKTHRSPAR
jgi:hypothetical protein